MINWDDWLRILELCSYEVTNLNLKIYLKSQILNLFEMSDILNLFEMSDILNLFEMSDILNLF